MEDYCVSDRKDHRDRVESTQTPSRRNSSAHLDTTLTNKRSVGVRNRAATATASSRRSTLVVRPALPLLAAAILLALPVASWAQMSLVLNPTEVTVAENGVTDPYQVKLSTQPTGNVTVTISSGDTDAATVDEVELTFTDQNWNTNQPVTVTGVDDDVDNFGGGRSVIITHTATGGGYDTSASVSVTVTNEGDTAGLTLALPCRVDDRGDRRPGDYQFRRC